MHDRAGKRRARVEPNAHAAGRAIVRDAAVVGHEMVRRIFGRHAALNGKAVRRDGLLRRQSDLRIVERHALGDQDLRLDDIDAGHFFGHRVFDLNPRVDFDEVELVRVGIDQKLDGAGVLVVRPARPIAIAASHSACRTFGSRFGAGAISTTF